MIVIWKMQLVRTLQVQQYSHYFYLFILLYRAVQTGSCTCDHLDLCSASMRLGWLSSSMNSCQSSQAWLKGVGAQVSLAPYLGKKKKSIAQRTANLKIWTKRWRPTREQGLRIGKNGMCHILVLKLEIIYIIKIRKCSLN